MRKFGKMFRLHAGRVFYCEKDDFFFLFYQVGEK